MHIDNTKKDASVHKKTEIEAAKIFDGACF